MQTDSTLEGVVSRLRDLSVYESIPVDSEKATKFQFLLDTAGFDHFARIEEAVNVCLASDDVRTA
jgi:hypothetical protein